MPYMHMLSDPGMNYTLDRPLLDGMSAARIKEIDAVAPQIKNYESWHAVWLRLAKRAEAEKRWIDAASVLPRRGVLSSRGRSPATTSTMVGQLGSCARKTSSRLRTHRSSPTQECHMNSGFRLQV